MRIILLAIVAPLVACSESKPIPVEEKAQTPPTSGSVAPDPSATPETPRVSTPPKPGPLKTFRDWTVGCDNGLRCTMASLGADGAEFPTVTLSITRHAGPSGGYAITIASREQAAARPSAIRIDGARFAVAGDRLAGTAAARVALAAVNGRALEVQDASGRSLGQVSLAGASAALRYIDAAQGRTGTVTATVARGTAAADAVPAPPVLPVVHAQTLAGTPAKPAPAQLAAMRRIARCEDPPIAAEPESFTAGGGTTLVLLPCSTGAYNLMTAAFAIRDGQVRPVQADVETGIDPDAPAEGPAILVNATVTNAVVTTFAKGRGLGDCGVSQSLVWDGTRLRLVEQSEMSECRGNTNYITTWRARVERR